MIKNLRLHIWVSILIFSFFFCCFLPNIVKLPKSLSFISSKINFGLDISGGTHLFLKVNSEDYLQNKIKRNTNDIIKSIREAGVIYSGFSIVSGGLKINITEQNNIQNNAQKLKDLVYKIDPRLRVEKNQDGSYLINYGENEINDIKADLVERSIEIIRKRIDFNGTKEVDIYKQGVDGIVLEVPGVNDPEKIKSLINTSAKLTFHLLHPVSPILNSSSDIESFAKDGYVVMPPYNKNDNEIFVVNSNVEVDGSGLSDAKATIVDEGPVVFFKFDTKSAHDFAMVTANNIGKPLAIVLDGKVVSIPMIKSQILGGSGVISGDFDIQKVKEIALLLRSGALPATLNVVEEGSVGPSLGSKFLKSGIYSFLASFLFVCVFLIARYKRLSIVAIISIFYNSVVVLGLFSLFGITLTIAGIAGLTLTIGMAVDANVLIFEKIIENKKFSQTSLSEAFSSAFSAILDSNITTLIAAFVIFALTFGSIKGFAVALSIGVLCSLYSCVSIARIATQILFNKGFFAKNS